jgi:predicted secreted Zn-dependent protease
VTRRLAAALCLLAAAASAEPIRDETVVHYSVAGATAAEVRAALERNPTIKAERHRVGTTAAEIHWQPGFDMRDGRCRVRSVKVTVTIVTTLPRWEAPPDAPAALRQGWERFLAALTEHEAGHAEIARRAARRIEDALWAAPSRRSCDGYGKRLSDAANALFDQAAQEQRDYDAANEFGAKQGVAFP